MVLWALVALISGVLATSAGAETNGATAVPPICSTAQDYDTWNAAAPAARKTFVGETSEAPALWIAVGAADYSCASQMHQVNTTCDGTVNPCQVTPIGFEKHVTATAFPDTIDAAGGDGQNVHIAMPDAAAVPDKMSANWSQCMPARTYYPGFCTPSEFNVDPNAGGYIAAGGTLYYRFRDATGVFSGPWTVSVGRQSPGFVIKRPANLSACTLGMNSCDYEVDFIRTTAGKPVNNADAQVLIPFTVNAPQPAWAPAPPGTLYAHDIVVPMLIVQSGGTAPKPSGGGTGGGGGAGTPVVPVAGSGATSSPGPGVTTIALPRGKQTLKPLRRGGPSLPASLKCGAASCTVTFKAPKGAKSTKATMLRGKTKVASASKPKKGALTLKPKPGALKSGRYTVRLDVVTKAGKTVSVSVSFTI